MCVDVDSKTHTMIVEKLSSGVNVLRVNLEQMEVIVANQVFQITMPSANRDMLTAGTWDTTATLLEAGNTIEAAASRLPYMQAAA